MNRQSTLGSVSLIAALVGCAPGGVEPIDKPVDGKADSPEQMCELIGERADCDICDLQGWYDDGECDSFCQSPDSDCAAADSGLRIFASSETYLGNLYFHNTYSDADGVEAGDALCMGLALDAELGGTWYAFLSADDVPAATRVQGAGPWVNMKGDVAFVDLASFEVQPSSNIGYDEHGVFSSTSIWTGTQTDGATSFASCGDWTAWSEDSSGTVWSPGYPSSFPDSGIEWCSTYQRLLCVEAP